MVDLYTSSLLTDLFKKAESLNSEERTFECLP